MAVQERNELRNACQWAARENGDGTIRRVKVKDCGKSTCKYSEKFVPTEDRDCVQQDTKSEN